MKGVHESGPLGTGTKIFGTLFLGIPMLFGVGLILAAPANVFSWLIGIPTTLFFGAGLGLMWRA